ncbi:hypothetical protein U1Q18_000616, partial [Sarracenia purpurea var. burkii]
PAFPDIIRQDEGIVSIGQELKEHGESNKSIKQSDDLVEIDTADEIPTVATAGMNAKDNTLISKLKQNKGKGASNWFDEEDLLEQPRICSNAYWNVEPMDHLTLV